MTTIDKRIAIANDIYFSLSRNQQRKFNSAFHTGFGLTHSLETIDMLDFKRISKNTELIKKLIDLKRMALRIA